MNCLTNCRTKNADLSMGKDNEEKYLKLWCKKMGYFKYDPNDNFRRRDFFNEFGDEMEQKSRRISIQKYDTGLMPIHKAKGQYRNLYFTFAYTDGYYYIKYDAKLFDTFKTKELKVWRDGKYDAPQMCWEVPTKLMIDVNTLEDFDKKMNKVMEHYQASMGIDCDILGLEEAMNQKE